MSMMTHLMSEKAAPPIAINSFLWIHLSADPSIGFDINWQT